MVTAGIDQSNDDMAKRIKLLYIAPHPMQYHAGIYRLLNKSKVCSLDVCYLGRMMVTEAFDKGFNVTYKIDIPLLDGYNHYFLKNFGFDRSGTHLFSRVNPQIIFKIRHYDVVLLHGHSVVSYWFALLMAKISGKAVIWRGEATRYPKPDGIGMVILDRFKHKLVKCFLNAADICLYSCEGNKEYLLAMGTEESKLLPIPCAVDNAFYIGERNRLQGSGERERKRDSLGIGESDVVFLMCSRLIERKRHNDLIEAMLTLRQRERAYDPVVLFVGDGIDRASLEKRCKRHDLRVIFTGFKNQSDISLYYLIADVFVMVSDYDPSPKSLNETMLFSLPVIASSIVGTARDLIREGENGFVIEAGDVEKLADCLEFFMDNPDKLKAMGEKSFDIVKEFTFEKDVKYIEEAVVKLCGSKRA